MFQRKPIVSRQAVMTAALLAAAGTVSAQETFTTLFGELPNPGLPTVLAGEGELSVGVGEFPDASVLNGLDAFTSFNVQNLNDGSLLGGSANEGQIIFLQNANFYVGGGQLFPVENGPLSPDGVAGAGPIAQQAISSLGQDTLSGIGILDTDGDDTNGLQTFNNRIFGVFGQGRSDIAFDAGTVTSVTVQAGITAGREDENGEFSGFAVGGNPAFGQSLPEGTHLADGDGTILIYTELGLQAAISLQDALADGSVDFDVINQDFTFSASAFDGDFITRISIINESTALNSAAFISELTVTTVPEPGSIALLALGGMAMLKRRRTA